MDTTLVDGSKFYKKLRFCIHSPVWFFVSRVSYIPGVVQNCCINLKASSKIWGEILVDLGRDPRSWTTNCQITNDWNMCKVDFLSDDFINEQWKTFGWAWWFSLWMFTHTQPEFYHFFKQGWFISHSNGGSRAMYKAIVYSWLMF